MLSENFQKVVFEVSTSQIQSHDGMRKSIPLINGHIVGHTITRVNLCLIEGTAMAMITQSDPSLTCCVP